MFFSRCLLFLVICGASAGVSHAQSDKQPAGSPPNPPSQTQTPPPECTDAVQCATECERGVGSSCYKLADMYDYGKSGVQKDSSRATEFYLKACDHGRFDGCNNAGVGLRTLNRPAEDARAVELFRKGCAGNEPYSCGNLGDSYEEGRGIAKNIPQAMEFLNKACSMKAYFACVRLGRILETGQAGKVDEARAFNLYVQACDGGSAVGCYDIATLYLSGAPPAVAKDPKLAVPFFKRACNNNYPSACDSLGRMYMAGNGVEKDTLRGIDLYQKACDANDHWGCNDLGLLYRDGTSVPVDLVRAIALFQKACDLGNSSGCTDVGFAYSEGRGLPKDERKAVEFYQKGCDGKNWVGCADLALMYRDGRGVAKDEARSVQLFTVACDADESSGCTGLGYALEAGTGVAKDEARSAKAYQKGCDLKAMLACSNLGSLYRDGRGVPKDEARSVQLYKMACDGGYANGCRNLGSAYEYARGVAMDEAKAAELYQQACRGSLESGCDDFKRLTQENRSLAKGSITSQPPAGGEGPSQVTTRGGSGTKVAPKRDQWALVVGISKYGAGVEGLRFARSDAEAFYSFLRSPSGGKFPENHILLLVDDQATSARVRGGVRDFLGQAGKDDVVVVFFAGHGAPDPRHPNALYLLTYDTAPDHLGQTAFDMEEIKSALAKTISSDRVVVYVDACHSAGISSLGTRESNDSSERVNRYLATLATAGTGIAMFSASQANELSRESEDWGGGHGVFTYYLIQGLQGAADRDKDGIVTLQELVDYVSENVKQATKFAQHPALSTSANWDPNLPVAVVH